MTEQQEQDLAKFAATMRAKLLKRDSDEEKTGWSNEAPFYLLERLHQETAELLEAFDKNDLQEIILECADVANFAMMLASNVRRLQEMDL